MLTNEYLYALIDFVLSKYSVSATDKEKEIIFSQIAFVDNPKEITKILSKEIKKLA